MKRLLRYRIASIPMVMVVGVLAVLVFLFLLLPGGGFSSPGHGRWWALLAAVLLADNLRLRLRDGRHGREQRLDQALQRDLTQRLQDREQELARCELLLRVQQEATPDAIVAFDAAGNLLSCNHRFRTLWQIPDALLALGLEDPIRDTVLGQLSHRSHLEALTLEARTDPAREIHEEIHTLDGRVLELYSRGLNDNLGRHHGRLWQYRDITDSRRNEAHLRRLATVDMLTGTANRRFFMEEARQRLQDGAHQPGQAALLLLDLDHFKSINDRWGHPGGDRVLERFAGVVRAVLREPDLFGRLGGEEFAVLLGSTRPGEALAVAERICEAVRAGPIAWDGQQIPLSVSIGIGLHAGGDDLTALLRRADLALYQAKAGGRDRVVVESEQIRRDTRP